MVEVVRWLNRHRSIFTIGCCQGDERNLPSVAFIPLTTSARNRVIRAAGGNPKKSKAEISYGEPWDVWPGSGAEVCRRYDHIIYHLRFDDLDEVLVFMSQVGKGTRKKRDK